VLEDDAAPALVVAAGEEPEGGLDTLFLGLGGEGQLLEGERARRDDEERPIVRASRSTGFPTT
jgi:hypothetical protein